jgi:hypothetical protein
MARKLALGIGGLVALLVVGLVLVELATALGGVSTDDDGTSMVDLAVMSVPVASAEPIMTDPDQFLGVPHAPPDFDTDGFGPELSFRQDPADVSPLDPGQARRAVYLGHDQDGNPYYIWYEGSRDLRQRIGQIFADFGSVGRFGSSYGGETTGSGLGGFLHGSLEDHIDEVGLTHTSLTSGSDQPTVALMEWHALPTEVAAVVFHLDGEVVGWQVPVSGTAAIQVVGANAAGFDFQPEMVALTADGETWHHYPHDSRTNAG